MTTSLDLSQPIHFTLNSGLVLEVKSGFWSPPQGRYGSLICIFEGNSGRLFDKIEPNGSIGFKSKIGYRMRHLTGSKLRVLAVGQLSKTFSFHTDFTVEGIKIPIVTITTTIAIKKPAEDIAASVIQDEDPLKNLCISIKSKLDSDFRTFHFENAADVNEFVDNFEDTILKMKLDNPYLTLEVLDVQYNIAKFKKDSFEKINKKKVITSKLESLRKYRDKILSEHSEVKDLHDIFYRIPQVIPNDIAGVEDFIITNIVDFMLETIRRYRDKTLSEHSEIKDIQEIIDLIPPSVPKREEIVINVNSLVKSVITIEYERENTLLPSSVDKEVMNDEDKEDNVTAQTERKRRWRGYVKSEDAV